MWSQPFWPHCIHVCSTLTVPHSEAQEKANNIVHTTGLQPLIIHSQMKALSEGNWPSLPTHVNCLKTLLPMPRRSSNDVWQVKYLFASDTPLLQNTLAYTHAFQYLPPCCPCWSASYTLSLQRYLPPNPCRTDNPCCFHIAILSPSHILYFFYLFLVANRCTSNSDHIF